MTRILFGPYAKKANKPYETNKTHKTEHLLPLVSKKEEKERTFS